MNCDPKLVYYKGLSSNGYWWQHWCAARESSCAWEARAKAAENQPPSKCSAAFLEDPCRAYYPNPYP